MMFLQGVAMIALTVVMYILSRKLYTKFKSPILNPVLITSISVIMILLLFRLDYHSYMVGGQWINQLLGSTVVCLAFPLYLNRHKILKYFKTIFVSVLTAVTLNFSLIYFTLKLLGYGREDIVTLLPRSITAAVGVQVSHQLGGEDTVTIMFIIATGLVGSMIGATLVRMTNFQTSIARGMTFGNASHAFGTARALEMDLESGAFSSIGMILSAVLSSVMLPILLMLFY
ncbi:LrgB family protein [Staphylococcus coagulans]|uniref:LrgB family protein n=1 Tax=Staphylococcus coagulans TaxID=74706 RepID=UPI0015FC4EAD|nr:LrgB family protein [Staphylococcus coagulans]MBA8764817.1 holin [Staphylococcus coagulans]MBT2810274.1 LrgB family protein [Staphylococcus coagulans]MBT2812126.1 LrgB family protein [Staphylococcus coagulans]MBT2819271.1 LrgB family protein [Staphylococcus coagulans]MBT2821709.1 LrgB family protein [Staphylococcus coagulans]